MWSMPPCAIGRPGDEAMHRDEGGVDDRQQHDQRREDQRRRRAGPLRRPGGERQAADREAEEQAPGVAHEDGRGRRVVQQEAGAGAAQPDGEERRVHPSRRGEQRRHRQRRDARDARREAVHVVEEVQGGRERHQPQDGQQRIEPDDAGHRQPQPEGHRDGGDDELGGELRLRVERAQVVEQAEPDTRGSADRETGERRRQVSRRHEADGGAGGNGQTAHQRYRTPVPAIAPRSGDEPEAMRQGRAQERGRRREHRRGQRGHDQEYRRRHHGTTRLRIMRASSRLTRRARRGPRAGVDRARRCRRRGGRCRSARPPRPGRPRRDAPRAPDPRAGR